MQAAFLDDVLELESAAVAQLAEGDAQQADGDELSFLRSGNLITFNASCLP